MDFSFRPQWGSVEITKAMFALLRRAVRDADDNDDAAKVEEGVGVDAAAGRRLSKFAFASESCVPVVPLTEALARVFASNHGWMRLRAKANNGYSQNKQFDVLRGKLPADCICKADQWVLLNRRQVRVPVAFLCFTLAALPPSSRSCCSKPNTQYTICTGTRPTTTPIFSGGSRALTTRRHRGRCAHIVTATTTATAAAAAAARDAIRQGDQDRESTAGARPPPLERGEETAGAVFQGMCYSACYCYCDRYCYCYCYCYYSSFSFTRIAFRAFRASGLTPSLHSQLLAILHPPFSYVCAGSK